MKKFFFSLFFIGLFLVPALADYQVDSVSVNADVAETGKTQVTMTMQLTFTTSTEEVTVPLAEREVSRVSVADCRFKTVSSDQGVDVVLKNRKGFLGTQTFLITYTVPAQEDASSEADRYELSFLSSRWARQVGACTFQVALQKLPEEPPRVQVLSGYYGELSEQETGLSVTETVFSGAVSARMAYDSLTISMELPEGYFQTRSSRVKGISITWVFVVMAAVLGLLVLYWRLKLRSGRVTGEPRLLLPEGVLPCQLPMVLDGVTCDVAATILQWANLGYLTIALNRRGTLVLTKTMEMGSERSRMEQRLFGRIFGNKLRVAAVPGRFRHAGEQFEQAARRAMSREFFDKTGGNLFLLQVPCQLLLAVAVGYLLAQMLPEGGGFLVLAVLVGLFSLIYGLYLHKALVSLFSRRGITPVYGALLLGPPLLLVLGLLFGALPECLVGVAACVFSGAVSARGPRRNRRGLDAMAQARGCRTFYRQVSWTRLQILHGENRRFFQSQLPSTVALGVDKRFAKRFERLPIPVPEWLSISGSTVMSAAALQQQLAPIIRQLRSAFC